MSVIFINQIIVQHLDDSIRRDKNGLCVKTNRGSDLLQSQDAGLKYSHDLALLKELAFLGPDFNLISQSQLWILIQHKNLVSIWTEMLDLLFEYFFDSQCIGLLFRIANQSLLVFFISSFVWFGTVKIMFLQNEVLGILALLWLTVNDSFIDPGHLFVVFQLFELLQTRLWGLIAHWI